MAAPWIRPGLFSQSVSVFEETHHPLKSSKTSREIICTSLFAVGH